MKIFITGYSVKAPSSKNSHEYFNNLKNKITMTTEETRYPKNFNSLPKRAGYIDNIEYFDHKHFNYNIKQVDKMDIIARMLLELTNEALIDSMVDINSLKGSNTGVYVGHCFSDYLNKIRNDEKITGYELVNSCPSMVAGKISYYYDFKGPSLVLDTACSSSLVALEKAVQDIRNGVIERAIVAGVSLCLDHKTTNMFNAYKMLSPDGICFTFDKRANGYCRSDGFGVIFLESSNVCNDGYAVIEGISINSDGHTSKGITYPSLDSQIEVAERTFESFGIDKNKIKYIEAHGTGTKVGDMIELNSLSRIYQGVKNLPIGSVKSNIGHAEGASGIMSIIKVLLMYEHNIILPNMNYESTSHQQLLSQQFRVVTDVEPLEKGSYVSISNYGFTGTNAFLVLSPGNIKYKHKPVSENILFSNLEDAESNTSLKLNNSFWRNQILNSNYLNYKYYLSDKWKRICCNNLIYIFPGQGSQIKDMGKTLLKQSITFQKTIERLSQYLEFNLLEIYHDGNKWFDKRFSPLGIVSCQIGIVNILKEFNVNPKYYIGHSLGEISCGYASGMLSEIQAIQIANVRCKLVEKIKPSKSLLITFDNYSYELCTTYQNKNIYYVENNHQILENEKKISMNGKMIVVFETKEYIQQIIRQYKLNMICIACYNTKKNNTVSGNLDQINFLQEKLEEDNIRVVSLDTDNIAYHSPLLIWFEDFLDNEFKKLIDEDLPLNERWLSCCNTKTFNVNYFTKNIINPVTFEETIKSVDPTNSMFMEISTNPYLVKNIIRINSKALTSNFFKQDKLNINNLWYHLYLHNIKLNLKIDRQTREPIEYRQQYLWDHTYKHRVLNFDDLNSNETFNNNVVEFDLEKEWKSLKGHIVDNNSIFPMTGYCYILWKVFNFSNIIIDNLEINQKVYLDNKKKIIFNISSNNNLYKIKYNNELVASASVRLYNDEFKFLNLSHNNLNIINQNKLYNYIEQYGYFYQSNFKSIESYDYLNNTIKLKDNIDWISYMDGILQMIIIQEKSSILPTFIKKMILTNYQNSENIVGYNNKILGNNNIQIQGYNYYNYYYTNPQEIVLEKEFWVNFGNNSNEKLKYLPQIFNNMIKDIVSFEKSEWIDKVTQILNPVIKESNSLSLFITNNSDVVDGDIIISQTMINNESYNYLMNFGNIHIHVKKFNRNIINDKNEVTKEKLMWLNKLLCQGVVGSSLSLNLEGYDINSYFMEDINDKPIMIENNMKTTIQKKDGTCGMYVYDNISDSKNNLDKYHLVIGKVGNINKLTWTSNQYNTKVYFSSLNFRDIMRSFGKLREKDITIGLEFSGVDDDNNRIAGIGVNTIGNYCKTIYKYKVPDSLTDEEAATIPITYLTAYYCILEKCRLKEGDTILIHAGSGGVGMACINICLARGIKVFTTCSKPKREFLKTHFNLKDNNIGNSRDLSFYNLIMKETNNKGVDAVINSLSNKFQETSIRCVAQFGNFCEIGKYDIINETHINQFLFERNISFHVIDLLPMLKDNKFHKLWDKYLTDGFKRKEIKPLPYKVFQPDNIKDAFRFMSKGKHIGKIIINFKDKFCPNNIVSSLHSEKIHLITGGLGGLGLELAKKLADFGSRKIYLVSRSGIKDTFQKFQFDQIKCNTEIIKKSVTELDQIEEVDIIWHLASTSNDSLFSNMTDRLWDEIYDVKVNGYLNLKNKFPNKKIIIFGSIASRWGNIGQTHYSYSNDCLKNYARKDNYTTYLELGPFGNVGMASKIKDNIKEKLKEINFFNLASFWKIFNKIDFNENVISIYSLNNELTNKNQNTIPNNATSSSTSKISNDLIISKLAELLGGDPVDFKSDEPLYNHGMDSLTIMEIISWINETYNINMKPSFINEETTINGLILEVSKYKQNEETELQPLHNEAEDKKEIDNDIIINKLVELLGGETKDFNSSEPLFNYGMDSLTIMEIVTWINETYHINVKPSFINEETCIDDLYKMINKNNQEINLNVESIDLENDEINIDSIDLENDDIEVDDIDLENDDIEIGDIDLFNNRLLIYKLWYRKNKIFKLFI